LPATSVMTKIESIMPAEHVALMGLDFANLTEIGANQFVLDALDRRRGGWICPVNLDVLRQVVHDDDLMELVSSAEHVVADGMPLLWASRLQGTPLPERIAGSSLISTLSARLGDQGRSVYLLGGSEGAAETAGATLQDMFPGLALSGWHCPPFGFERSSDEMEQIVTLLKAAQPDVVFVGLGFPKQDRLIAVLRQTLPAAWFVSCGVSFSYLAGEVRRAPSAVQKLGFEWAYRLAQEPRRLAKRYLLQGLPFAIRLFAWSLYTRLAGVVRLKAPRSIP
jgi:N-acetylglucosaminyldiphosphoundecaprenol N-acetyl-beta-D-mannosaminyltransferase